MGCIGTLDRCMQSRAGSTSRTIDIGVIQLPVTFENPRVLSRAQVLCMEFAANIRMLERYRKAANAWSSRLSVSI